MIYGYARVSTDGQSVEAQVTALTDAGAEKVFREVASGAKTDRAQLRRSMGPSQSWGSGGHCHWRVWVVGRQEFLPETGAECTVVDGAADLEQPIGTAPRPAHLLRFVHARVDEEIGRALGQRCGNPQPGPVPFAIVDQSVALPDEIAVQRLQ